MAYAAVQDLIDRYGQQEMIRLTTPADQEMDGVNGQVAQVALDDASAEIDVYVGKRYRVPMDVAPGIIVAKCCAMARYRLASGEQKNPTEQMRTDYADAMAFLRDIAAGKAVLELDEVASSDEGYAQASDRPAIFGHTPWT